MMSVLGIVGSERFGIQGKSDLRRVGGAVEFEPVQAAPGFFGVQRPQRKRGGGDELNRNLDFMVWLM
jgi:hypothetical protein